MAEVMGMLQTLDSAIREHVVSFATVKGWRDADSYDSAERAYHDYTCQNIAIRLSIDRGLIEFEIGPATDTMRPVSLFRDYLEPAPRGRWNLSLAECVEFLARHWDELNEKLGPKSWQCTIKELDVVGNRTG